MLTEQLKKNGVNKTVVVTTVFVVACSVIITAITLWVFRGYIDYLGIVISIVVPSIILPIPFGKFYSLCPSCMKDLYPDIDLSES